MFVRCNSQGCSYHCQAWILWTLSPSGLGLRLLSAAHLKKNNCNSVRRWCIKWPAVSPFASQPENQKKHLARTTTYHTLHHSIPHHNIAFRAKHVLSIHKDKATMYHTYTQHDEIKNIKTKIPCITASDSLLPSLVSLRLSRLTLVHLVIMFFMPNFSLYDHAQVYQASLCLVKMVIAGAFRCPSPF